MDKFILGIIAFPVLFSMMAFRVPIGLSMLIVGCSGTILIAGWLPILSQVKTSAWHLFSNYSLSVIPLFLLMGNFAGKAGMSEALFKFTGACLGHRKGGVAMAAIGACAGFGAICGSSLATAATMGKVALPELRRLGYSGALKHWHISSWRNLRHINTSISYSNNIFYFNRTKHSQDVFSCLYTRYSSSTRLHISHSTICKIC
jgi:TRAP-type mannitol/chloroaromatic compound transport system permease large subunit